MRWYVVVVAAVLGFGEATAEPAGPMQGAFYPRLGYGITLDGLHGPSFSAGYRRWVSRFMLDATVANLQTWRYEGARRQVIARSYLRLGLLAHHGRIYGGAALGYGTSMALYRQTGGFDQTPEESGPHGDVIAGVTVLHTNRVFVAVEADVTLPFYAIELGTGTDRMWVRYRPLFAISTMIGF